MTQDPKIAAVLHRIVWGFTIAFVAIATVLGLFYTAVPASVANGTYTETMVLMRWTFGKEGLKLLLGVIVCAALFALFMGLASRIERAKTRRLAIALIAVAAIIQVAWLVSLDTETFTYDDTLSLAYAAQALLDGDYEAFQASPPPLDFSSGQEYYQELRANRNPGLYLSLYPHQCGGVLFFAGIFAMFGSFNYFAIQIANVIANCFTILIVALIAEEIFRKSLVTNIALILSAFCIPLLLLSEFAYGNEVGMAFAFGALLFMAKAANAQDTGAISRNLVFAITLLFVAVSIKQTFVLFDFVLLFCLILIALRTKSRCVVPVLIGLVGFVLVWKAAAIWLAVVQSMTGADFGDGMPNIVWIAMGLRDEDFIYKGWWSYWCTDTFLQAGGDAAIQSQLAKTSIASSGAGFAANPAEGFGFFRDKLASEWSDPTFQSLYYAAKHAEAGAGTALAGLSDFFVFGKGRTPLWCVLDGYQLFVYIAALYGLIAGWRGMGKSDVFGERRADAVRAASIVAAAFSIGFFVYILWEAKSVYVLPFFVLLIPFAAFGLARFAEVRKGRTS